LIAEAPKDDAAAPAPAAPAPAEPAADAQPAVDEPRAEPAADAEPSADEPAADAEPPADQPSAEPAAADAEPPADQPVADAKPPADQPSAKPAADAKPPAVTPSPKRAYNCSKCGKPKKTACTCNKAADVTTVTGEPAFATALRDQIKAAKDKESKSKGKAERLQEEANEAATLIRGLAKKETELKKELATVKEQLTQKMTVVSRCEEARKEHAKHEQALEQRENSKMPKPGFYDHCLLPKGCKSVARIMKIIDPVFKAHIEGQFVTRTSGRFPKKLYVGIVNALERLYRGSSNRYKEHKGTFGQIIMMALLEMENAQDTAYMESEVIETAKVCYPGLVENARGGGGGVVDSIRYEPRFFLYICFEA